MEASVTYPAEIAKAIIAVKKQVKQLGSDEKNEHGGYAYVSVDKFYQQIGKLMAEAGLALLIDETESRIDAGASGKPWLFVQYGLRFMHESGAVADPLRRSLAMPISGPQAYGAAQSYIEKQFLRQVFKIPTGDKDADATAQDDAPPPRQAPRAGMVRAADVPPQKANGNGGIAGKSTVEHPKRQEALDAYAHIAKSLKEAKTPGQIDELIKINGNDLALVKEVHAPTYDDLMKLANVRKMGLYGETG